MPTLKVLHTNRSFSVALVAINNQFILLECILYLAAHQR
jgi:hypothetical protein